MSKNLYTLSLDSIKYILGLIRDTFDLPANILDDLHIQSTTTYSSYRLDTLLKALKEENIQYCDEAISKLNKLSKEIITDKLKITNENTIYLLLTDPVNNVYEQWLLINGTPQMIGTTEMKLDSVYTKDEADDRYALLADFNTLTTNFNNLATTVNGKIDKDKIVTVLDDTVTDEQVPTAKAVYDGLENINDFSVQVVQEKLDLNDITETGIYYFSQVYTPVNIPVGVNGWLLVMKGSSSDIVKQVWYRLGGANSNSYNTFERYKANNTWSEWTKFLTEREYYNALDYGNPIISQDADLNDYLTPGVYTCMSSEIANTLVNCPHIYSNFKLIVNRNRGNSNTFYGYQMIVGTKGGNPVTDVCVYYRGISMYDNACVFSKWKIMSGSTVADVTETNLTLTSVDKYKFTYENNNTYLVKNGMCYVKFDITVVSPVSANASTSERKFCTLPKASTDTFNSVTCYNSTTLTNIYMQVGQSGYLSLWGGTAGHRYIGSFSYPVAE